MVTLDTNIRRARQDATRRQRLVAGEEVWQPKRFHIRHAGCVQALFAQTAGGAAFTPLDIPSLVSWNDISNMSQSDATNVTSATDRSGNGHNYTTAPSGGNVPVYHTNTGPNSNLPSMTLDGAGSKSGLIAGGTGSSTYPYTLGAVVKLTSTAANSTLFGSTNVGTGGLIMRTASGASAPNLLASNVASIATSSTSLGTTAWHTVIATIDASAYAFYVDGVAAGNGSHSQALTASRVFTIGDDYPGGTAGWNGLIGEMLIVAAIISSGNRASLVSYWQTKWGTP